MTDEEELHRLSIAAMAQAVFFEEQSRKLRHYRRAGQILDARGYNEFARRRAGRSRIRQYRRRSRVRGRRR